MGSSVREPGISGSSNALQGVRESIARTITSQASLEKDGGDVTMGLEGCDPARGESPPYPHKLLRPEPIRTVKSNSVMKSLGQGLQSG
jgi:hypothetical protein